jgi:hypothetical protein
MKTPVESHAPTDLGKPAPDDQVVRLRLLLRDYVLRVHLDDRRSRGVIAFDAADQGP